MNFVTNAAETIIATVTNQKRTEAEIQQKMKPGNDFETNNNLLSRSETLDAIACDFLEANRQAIYDLTVFSDVNGYAKGAGERVKIGDLIKQGKLTEEDLLRCINNLIRMDNGFISESGKTDTDPLGHGRVIHLPDLSGVRSVQERAQTVHLSRNHPTEWQNYFASLERKPTASDYLDALGAVTKALIEQAQKNNP